MIYDCFYFYTDYYRIDELKEKEGFGEKYYKLYADPDAMNCPYGSSCSCDRSIGRDCILKIRFDLINEGEICDFYLGDFDEKGNFRTFIHFDAVFNKVMMKFNDETVDFIYLY